MTVSRVSLSTVLNKDFVATIEKMAKKTSSKSVSNTKDLGWSDTLQSGARIYANSVSSLNSLINYLNISKDTLSGLLKITDDMLKLTEKAKSPSVQTYTRKRLNIKYGELVKEFKELVSNASLAEKDLLTKEGLSKLFSIIGLDPEKSEAIAEVFDKFIFDGDNESLVSEKIKPKKEVSIPKSAYGKVITSENSKYAPMTISTNAKDGTLGLGGIISNNVNVLSSVIDGKKAVSFISNSTGEKIVLRGDGVEYELKDVNKEMGLSIVSKYETDINYASLYLTDNRGNFLKKLTTDELNYSEAKISENGSVVIFSSFSEDSNIEKIEKVDISDLSSPLILEEVARREGAASAAFTNLQISSDGGYTAYSDTENMQNYLLRSSDFVNDDDFSSNTNITKFGFIDLNTIAVYDGSNILSYEYGSNDFKTIKSGVLVEEFSTISNNLNGLSYIAYSEPSANNIKVINNLGQEITSYNGEPLDSIKQLTLSYNSSQVVELGVFGTLKNIDNSTQDEFVRFSGEKTNKFSRVSKTFSSIFDKNLNLSNSIDAYKLSNALGDLKETLETNIKTMDEMFNVIESNLELVKATGFALLDLSSEVLTSETADIIAKKLRSEIIKNAPKALSQANNLEPLAVASLLLNNEL
ncbi:MAG: hypothetical protein ACOX3T_05605 [Bdellovibrionota bacterium]